jgi:uncharacterized membrane protein
MEPIHAFWVSLAGFILLHVGLSGTGLRAMVTRQTGEPLYQGLFSLASVGLLVALVLTYGPAHASVANVQLWTPPSWGRHVAHGLVLLGFLLAVSGYLALNPTSIGMGEVALKRTEAATGVSRITRHPFLWGVSLWAVGHLFANGDLVGVSLFAGLLIMVQIGTGSIDAKLAARDPERWQQLKAATSNLPFAAIMGGRNRLVLAELWWRFAVAILAYGAVAWGHGALFGKAVFGA